MSEAIEQGPGGAVCAQCEGLIADGGSAIPEVNISGKLRRPHLQAIEEEPISVCCGWRIKEGARIADAIALI